VIGFAYPNLNNTPLVENRNGSFYILGKPVIEVDDAPAIGAANFPVAFGDLKQGYAAGIHKNVSILRDPYTAAPNVRFYGLGRMGGTVWNKDAVILLKSNNA
jgi:HK97 family phage major capsid protein